MATFGIDTARAFLNKLHEEQQDFENAHCLSARHAINAVMTAYHLHEWVWGSFAKQRSDLHSAWQLSKKGRARREDFRRWVREQCPAFEDAEKVANGSKHFASSAILTGKHSGVFQRNVFQPDAFDVPYLWIERRGKKQPAEEFIGELTNFWQEFFATYDIPP